MMNDVENIEDILEESLSIYSDKKEEFLDINYANGNSTEPRDFSTYSEVKPRRIIIKCDIKSRE